MRLYTDTVDGVEKLNSMCLVEQMGVHKFTKFQFGLTVARFTQIQCSLSLQIEFHSVSKGLIFLPTKPSQNTSKSKVTSYHVNGETGCCVLAFILPMHCLDVNA